MTGIFRRVSGPGNGAVALALPSVFAELPPGIAPDLGREWESLRQERDPELRAAGMLALAGRLEISSRPVELSFAASLYQQITQSPFASAREAQDRLEALQGKGSFGRRFESFARSFVRQSTDPAMLVGMGLASGVFTLTRIGVLSRLLASPAAGLWTRGWGAGTAASLCGFALEPLAFNLGTRLTYEALGRTQEWGSAAWSRELASSYLLLGAMRLAGTVGARHAEPLPAISRPIFQQGLTLGGIFLGHRLEQWVGLRASQDAGATLAESLAMLLQAHVAGRLGSGMLGADFSRLDREMNWRETMLRSELPNRWTTLEPWGPRPVLAGAEAFAVPPKSDVEGPQASIHSMSAISFGSGGGTTASSPVEARFNQLVRPRFSEAALEQSPRSSRRPKLSIRRIGLLTSGGDGPGENAAIAALVRGAIDLYGWEPLGILDGYRGLIEPQGRIWSLQLKDIEGEAGVNETLRRIYGDRLPYGVHSGDPDISTLGGNLLRSSRTNPVQGDPQAARVYQTMQTHGIDALIVLGGNGSMRAADALSQVGIPVVGIPQSIDLDVWGSEHSIGFPSAVAKGAVELHHFLNTAHSCQRWFLVEAMGQHYGMLTLAIGREGGADSVFTEIPRPLSEVRQVMEAVAPRSHGVILVSEGVKFHGEGISVIEPPRGRDHHGRLLNESGDVVRWLRGQLAEIGIPNTRSESLGYLLRGADPTVHEILLAQTLSRGALRLVHAGRFGRMVGTGFVRGSSELRLNYPRLSRVAAGQKSPPEEYYRWVRQYLEGRE